MIVSNQSLRTSSVSGFTARANSSWALSRSSSSLDCSFTPVSSPPLNISSCYDVFGVLNLAHAPVVVMLGGNPQHDRFGFRYWYSPGPFVPYLAKGATGNFAGFWAIFVQAAYAFGTPDFLAYAAGEAQSPRRVMPNVFSRVIYRLVFFYVLGALATGILVSDDAWHKLSRFASPPLTRRRYLPTTRLSHNHLLERDHHLSSSPPRTSVSPSSLISSTRSSSPQLGHVVSRSVTPRLAACMDWLWRAKLRHCSKSLGEASPHFASWGHACLVASHSLVCRITQQRSSHGSPSWLALLCSPTLSSSMSSTSALERASSTRV